jgi:hypothetical protein
MFRTEAAEADIEAGRRKAPLTDGGALIKILVRRRTVGR